MAGKVGEAEGRDVKYILSSKPVLKVDHGGRAPHCVIEDKDIVALPSGNPVHAATAINAVVPCSGKDDIVGTCTC